MSRAKLLFTFLSLIITGLLFFCSGPALASDNIAWVLSWSPVSGATRYEFQLALNPDFTAPVVDTEVASTSIQAINLDTGTDYFWRVRATMPVLGDWSTIARFMIVALAPPPAPLLIITKAPPPVINIPTPPPAQHIVIPPQPTPQQIVPGFIWTILVIAAVLFIAVITLIVRTRTTPMRLPRST